MNRRLHPSSRAASAVLAFVFAPIAALGGRAAIAADPVEHHVVVAEAKDVDVVDAAVALLDELEREVRRIVSRPPNVAAPTKVIADPHQRLDVLRELSARTHRARAARSSVALAEIETVAQPRPHRSGRGETADAWRDPMSDALGIALTTTGGVLVLAGVGFVVGGTAILSREDRELEDVADATEAQRDAFTERENLKAAAWLSGGGGTILIGAVGLVWGGIRLAHRRQEQRRGGAHLRLAPGGPGVVVGGSFGLGPRRGS